LQWAAGRSMSLPGPQADTNSLTLKDMKRRRAVNPDSCRGRSRVQNLVLSLARNPHFN